MKYRSILLVTLSIWLNQISSYAQHKNSVENISVSTMRRIYNEIKTPYKYGIVFQQPDSARLVDSPTIFRHNNIWYMTYIIYDGRGYETWLAQSSDLLHWKSKGKILSFSENTWDSNQKAGYLSLIDITWGGSYHAEKFNNSYWISYLGGSSEGYKAGYLGIGVANSDSVEGSESWKRTGKPVLDPNDTDARWFENKTIFKSIIIHDVNRITGHPFIMYYNARGDSSDYESIGMAVSDNMTVWNRYGNEPVITHYKGICGDAQIAKYNGIYIMFYFGAFWKPGAFERFACSYDLVHWTEWTGEDLIASSEDYDKIYAHKPWMIKWKGVVYHFYTAVGNQGRVIALATSKKLKK